MTQNNHKKNIQGQRITRRRRENQEKKQIVNERVEGAKVLWLQNELL